MMRTSEMPERAFILKDKKEALNRFYKHYRDVWAVYTSNAPSAKPIWVETGALTRTQVERNAGEKKAVEVVQIRTGKTATQVAYDP